MVINKGFKYKIEPNNIQTQLIEQTFGNCRFVYNEALNYRINSYKLNNKSISYKETSSLLTQIKDLEAYSFLRLSDATALQSSLKNLDTAYKNFFKDKKVGFPKYKSKHNNVQSYISKNNSGTIDIIDNKYVKLPKLGLVRIKLHRQLPKNAKINNATVSRSGNKYYVSINCEYLIKDKKPKLKKCKSIGLDYSSSSFAISSEGIDLSTPHYFRIYENNLSKEQRKLSRMQLYSNNWYKQKAKVYKIQEKISNSRKDCLHKLSKTIVNNYDYIFLEDLNLKNIAQSLKLGKSTYDNGFGMFREMLSYKAKELGKVVVKVDKWFASTKTCNVCGHKNTDITLKTREWTCPKCGTYHDRDINAAINIKKEGLHLLKTVGTTGLARVNLAQ